MTQIIINSFHTFIQSGRRMSTLFLCVNWNPKSILWPFYILINRKTFTIDYSILIVHFACSSFFIVHFLMTFRHVVIRLSCLNWVRGSDAERFQRECVQFIEYTMFRSICSICSTFISPCDCGCWRLLSAHIPIGKKPTFTSKHTLHSSYNEKYYLLVYLSLNSTVTHFSHSYILSSSPRHSIRYYCYSFFDLWNVSWWNNPVYFTLQIETFPVIAFCDSVIINKS